MNIGISNSEYGGKANNLQYTPYNLQSILVNKHLTGWGFFSIFQNNQGQGVISQAESQGW